MPGRMKLKWELILLGEIINNFRYADDTTNGRKQRGTKAPPDEGKRGE